MKLRHNHQTRRRIGIATGILFGFASITATFVLAAEDVVVEPNLTYGKAGDVELQLDLARPAQGTGPYPAIVYIHGGAWAGGNREVYRSSIERAARKGYVAVAISYRLTQPDMDTWVAKVPFPGQIQDCKCAIRWLRSEADRYHIDADHIAVTGGSAGGHLSLLVGLADERAGLEGDGGHAQHSSRVQAVVNYCGPTALVEEFRDVKAVQPYLQALCGGTPETAPESYKAASPLTYITADAPPVLTFHGDQDDIVPVSQAQRLDQAMQKAGARHALVILKGEGHGLPGQSAQKVDREFWTFIEAHLKPQEK